jgi:hypothetical protein
VACALRTPGAGYGVSAQKWLVWSVLRIFLGADTVRVCHSMYLGGKLLLKMSSREVASCFNLDITSFANYISMKNVRGTGWEYGIGATKANGDLM